MKTTEVPSDSSDLEREALDVAQSGSLRERLRLAARAGLRLLRDPSDTKQVFVMAIAVNGASFPRLIGRFAASNDGLDLLQERPFIDTAHVDFDALRALPGGTLGREYVRYLDEHDLDPDLFQEPPGLPPVPAFVARRFRQTHDIWHVLGGYEPDVPGEVALQAFTYAQTRMPSPLLIAVLGVLRFGWRNPNLLPMTVDGFRRGLRAEFLGAVRWEDLWEVPVDELRARLGLTMANA